MFRIVISSILLLYTAIAFCQIDFGNKLYNKIVFEGITCVEKNGELLNSVELYNVFFTEDTIVNCWSEKNPEFRDNYYSGTGYFIAEVENELDTVTNNENSLLLDLIKTERDDNGYYSQESLQFSFNKAILSELNIQEDKLNTSNDNKLITFSDDYWSLKEIKMDNKSFLLDSCHKSYQLIFNQHNQFKQNYEGYAKECITVINIEETKNDNRVEYWYENIVHKLTTQEGIWKTRGNQLVMINNDNKLRLYEYKVKDGLLSIKRNNHYEIILTREKYE